MTLKEDIEKVYASAQEQSDKQDNKLKGEDECAVSREQADFISAPNSYKQEYKDKFCTLPREWQEYLATREKEVEQGLSRARNNYHWVEKAFQDRRDKLNARGYHNAQEYFNDLVNVSDALENDPAPMLNALENLYGSRAKENMNPLQRQLFDLQNQINEQRKMIAIQNDERIQKEYDAFVNAKDDFGNAKHIYFEDVKDQMALLLNAGLAKNFEDAYSQALWRVDNVRNQLLGDMAEAEIERRRLEAQKAKTAAFNPNSKVEGAPRKLSLREEIERNYDRLMGE